MGYAITRVLIICMAFLLSFGGIVIFSLLAKKHKKKFWVYTGLAHSGIVFFICSVLLCTPFENLLYTFDSPEQIAQYSITGNIVSVVEGNDSSLIVYNYGSAANAFIIVEKNNDGYKICSKLCYQKVKKAHNDQICIYRTDNSLDYYLIIQGFFGNGPLEFTYNNGGTIPVDAVSIYQDTVIVNGALLVDNMESFIVYINGEPIVWDGLEKVN